MNTIKNETAQHTPGPWHIYPDNRRWICADDRMPVAYTQIEARELPQNAANALLIAAAPELLAMLARILDGVLRLPELPATLCALDVEQARAAIAAAKGGRE